MNVVDLYGIDSSLKKQVELTKKIIERMDIMIDAMKRDLNISNESDREMLYTPSEKKEWYGIPDSLGDVIKLGFNPGLEPHTLRDIWGDSHSYPENDDIDNMDACLVRNVAKAQRKTILKMEIEMEALRAIIDDMREQANHE